MKLTMRRVFVSSLVVLVILMLAPAAVAQTSYCDVVAAYCPIDDYYYDICAISASAAECEPEEGNPIGNDLYAAIAAAGMEYHGDEPWGCSAGNCLDEPCLSGNPVCGANLSWFKGNLIVMPWKVGVHVTCCNGTVIKGAAFGFSYQEAYCRAKKTALRVAQARCNDGCGLRIRCYTSTILQSQSPCGCSQACGSASCCAQPCSVKQRCTPRPRRGLFRRR